MFNIDRLLDRSGENGGGKKVVEKVSPKQGKAPTSSTSSSSSSVFINQGNSINPATKNKKLMTAKDREEYYHELHTSTLREQLSLKEKISSALSEIELKFGEIEMDRISNFEIEELNQQSFIRIQEEVRKVRNDQIMENDNLKAYTGRCIEALDNEVKDIGRREEMNRLTAEKKKLLRDTIESNIQNSVLKSIDSRVEREFENVRLNIRANSNDTERAMVGNMKMCQDVERKLFTIESKMYEMEKTKEEINKFMENNDTAGGGRKSNNGSGGYHGINPEEQMHRMNVMEFSMKGIQDRFNDLENEVKAKDEKIDELLKKNGREIEEKGRLIREELIELTNTTKVDMEKIMNNTKLHIQHLIFGFETSAVTNSETLNKEAISTAREAFKLVERQTQENRRALVVMEGKIGQCRIEFDRMAGDTEQAVAALADGLASNRGELRRVENRVESDVIERRGAEKHLEERNFMYSHGRGDPTFGRGVGGGR